jgi:hypothetical protein
MPDPTGPHLNLAVICERVLTEQDGVTSIIRVIDRITFGANPDGELIDPRFPLTLFVNFKSGAALGSHDVAIEVEKPSTERTEIVKAPVRFEGQERGVNVVVQMVFEPEPESEGLYWFDVLFNGERVTRMPLRVVFQRQATVGEVG